VKKSDVDHGAKEPNIPSK